MLQVMSAFFLASLTFFIAMFRAVRHTPQMHSWLWVTGGLTLSGALQSAVLGARAAGFAIPSALVIAFSIGCMTLIMVGLTMAYRFEVSALSRLQESEEHYRFLIDGLAEGVAVIDAQDRVHIANPSAALILGADRRLEEGLPRVGFITEEGTALPADQYPHRVTLRTGEAYPVRVAGLHRQDGLTAWVMVSARPLFMPGSGTPHAAVVSFFDVTEHRAATERLRLQAAALESVASAVMVTDPTGRITWVNPAFTRLSGFAAAEVIGRLQRMIGSDWLKDALSSELWETIHAGRPWTGEVYNRHKDGSVYVVEMTITPIVASSGEVASFVAVMHDISERKRHQEQLQFLSMHDALTGLPNRSALEKQLALQVERAHWGNRGVLFLLDIDNFLLVNETAGYAGGDEIIRRLVELLGEAQAPGRFVARVNGDEFAILLEDASEHDARAFATDLQARVSDSLFRLDGRVFSLSISIGGALMDGNANAEYVQSLAILALDAAKAQGNNHLVLYSSAEERGTRNTGANAMAAHIKEALRENLLVLHYQPIVDLANGKTEHFEALVRMRMADGELVYPDRFLPVAERYGLMPWIDRWVVEQAVGLLERLPNLHLFVNLSGNSLGDQSLLRSIEDRVGTSQVAARIAFEVTETSAIQDPHQVQLWIRSLRDLGCRFALDDFGLGFSSLSHLRTLPADYIKIDRSFVRNLDTDAGNREMVKAICTMAETFGKQVIAEGVETEVVAEALIKLGVGLAQGYLWGRPAPDLIVAQLT